jgi:hypothetical protein
MNLTNDDELHLENSIISIFNVEVSLHVCSFCHRFGHLLTYYPYRSSRVEVQPVLIVAFPSINHVIALVPNYPNLVPRNSGSHLGIRGNRGEFLRFLNPTKNPLPSPECYGVFLAPASMKPYWPMMRQPYQGGRPDATPGWGWPSMMPANVATPVTAMVKVGGGGLLDAGEGFSRPSSKGQPKGPNHSTWACERVLREVFNSKRAKIGVRSARGGGKPPSRPTPAMTTPVGGPWIGPPWTTWYLPW